jgi:hypothetical protein
MGAPQQAARAFFFSLQINPAVGSAVSQLDPQLAFSMRDQILRAVEPATDVGTNRDVVSRNLD